MITLLLDWLVISWMFIQNKLQLLNLLNQHTFLRKPTLPASEHSQAAVLFRKWLRAQEQHMFAEMRQSWKIFRIAEISWAMAAWQLRTGSLKARCQLPKIWCTPKQRPVSKSADQAWESKLLSNPFSSPLNSVEPFLAMITFRMWDLRFLPTCTSRAAAARSAAVSEQQSTRKPFRSVEAL